MTRALHMCRPSRDTTGFTLIEAVMSMLIVGLMLVAALNTVGASKLAQSRNAEQTLGPLLAQELMAEILSRAYEEPVDTVAFGLEGEAADIRTDWDDIDDYHGWSASPPQNQDGSVVTGADGYQRIVSVTWADALVPDHTSVSPSDLKRIDVKVIHNGRTVAALSSLRSYAWPEEGAALQSSGGDLISQSVVLDSKDFFKSLFK